MKKFIFFKGDNFTATLFFLANKFSPFSRAPTCILTPERMTFTNAQFMCTALNRNGYS